MRVFIAINQDTNLGDHTIPYIFKRVELVSCNHN